LCLSFITSHFQEVKNLEEKSPGSFKLRQINLLSQSVASSLRNQIQIGSKESAEKKIKCSLCNKSLFMKKKHRCPLCNRIVCTMHYTKEKYPIPKIFNVNTESFSCSRCEEFIRTLAFGASDQEYAINPKHITSGKVRIPNSTIETVGNKHLSPSMTDRLGKVERKYGPGTTCDVVIWSIEGKDLMPKDLNGLSDPFVVVQTEDPLNPKKPKKLWKSKIEKKTLNPSWKLEQYLLQLDFHKDIVFIVYDHDLIGRKEFMGSVQVKPIVVYYLQQASKTDVFTLTFEQLNPQMGGKHHTVSGTLTITLTVEKIVRTKKDQPRKRVKSKPQS